MGDIELEGFNTFEMLNKQLEEMSAEMAVALLRANNRKSGNDLMDKLKSVAPTPSIAKEIAVANGKGKKCNYNCLWCNA